VKTLLLALRLLSRDFRAGELRILVLAILVAVGGMTAVGFFTDRIQRALVEQGVELLGADLVLVSSAPARAELVHEAQRLRLTTAATLSFPSVVLAGERPQMVDVKAVDSGYPLRGTLRTAPTAEVPEQTTRDIPAPGEVWVDPRLLTLLGLAPGDRLSLGAIQVQIARVLTYEPDRGGDMFSLGPRVLLNSADIGRTRLVLPGSRVSYRLLLSGEPGQITAYRAWAEPRLKPGERLMDVRDARPELKVALDRAEKFLGLAALVSVLLAGVAVAVATRRYVERHLDGSALLRCFGATQARVVALYGLQMLALGLVASLFGSLLGLVAQAALAKLLAGLLGTALPAPSLWPLVIGLLVGVVTLLGFSLPPLLRLKSVPPLRVIRRDLGPLPVRWFSVYGAALLAMGLLMFWQVRNASLTLIVLGVTLATLAALGLVAWLLVKGLGLLRAHAGLAWRFGLANIARRPNASIAQILAFGLGLMVLLMLLLVRGDLLAAWQKRLPPDAPNHFLINVLPNDVARLKEFLVHAGVGGRDGPQVFPMVRGRLTHINDRPVAGTDYADDRARNLLEREFNLSWSTHLQEDNRVVAGAFWGAQAHGVRELSVEKGLAETLGIKLGDALSFRILDRDVRASVTSLRSVEWDSFRANFFVLAPPGVLEEFPATWITSFYLPPERKRVAGELVRAFPSVTVIDLEAIMTRVRGIMQRVDLSIEVVFVFTLLAGLMVLYATIQATQDVRLHETAILRALGASRARLIAGLLAEFALLGLLAGLLAAFAASAAGLVLAREVFHLSYTVNPLLWLIGPLVGALSIGLFGFLGTRRVLNVPPLATLREL
jgi:putative ABC transport system permease protein